jgi:predicted metal-binding membrane protein
MTVTDQRVPATRPGPARPGAVKLAGLLVALGAAAWLVLAVTHDATHAHHRALTPGPAVTGWLVMVVAMMLPTALPLLELIRGFTARRRGGPAIVALCAGIYVATWTAAGVVLVALNLFLDRQLSGWAWAAEHPRAPLGAALMLAGAYQFSSVKDRCLTVCRSPRGVAMLHWRGVRPAWAEASVVAAVYAASCVGCCWALMALGLLTGAGSLTAMAVLTALMAAERLTRHGKVLVRPAGAAAVILGAALLLGAVPA